MKCVLIISVVTFFMSSLSWAKAQFSDSQLLVFQEQVKSQNKIPAKAVDIIFAFYKTNRQVSGGLVNGSCIDKPEYRLRYHDKKYLTKEKLKQGLRNQSCLCVMDYTKSKYQERGHCIFLKAGQVAKVESFLVTHGRGSKEKDGYPVTFANKTSPTGTTLSGLFITGPRMFPFQSLGGSDYGRYRAPGLALYGVEESNWTASRVGKVSHGAPYVKYNKKMANGVEVGLSKGCPAMPVEKARTILPQCAGGAAWLNYTQDIAEQDKFSVRYCSTKKTTLK